LRVVLHLAHELVDQQVDQRVIALKASGEGHGI
jgi:hypothetical protein